MASGASSRRRDRLWTNHPQPSEIVGVVSLIHSEKPAACAATVCIFNSSRKSGSISDAMWVNGKLLSVARDKRIYPSDDIVDIVDIVGIGAGRESKMVFK